MYHLILLESLPSGIQQYLYVNGRIDNIFYDPYYERFTECLDEVARKFSVLYNDSRKLNQLEMSQFQRNHIFIHLNRIHCHSRGGGALVGVQATWRPFAACSAEHANVL